MAKFIRLTDWLVSEKSVRGSKIDDRGRVTDNGTWHSGSSKPIAYDAVNNVVRTQDATEFYLDPNGICTAVDMDTKSRSILKTLPRFTSEFV